MDLCVIVYSLRTRTGITDATARKLWDLAWKNADSPDMASIELTGCWCAAHLKACSLWTRVFGRVYNARALCLRVIYVHVRAWVCFCAYQR